VHARPLRLARAEAGGVTVNGAGDGGPAAPEVAGDERGEDAPGGAARGVRADEAEDRDTLDGGFGEEGALGAIVDVEVVAPAAGAPAGPVGVGGAEAAFVVGEVVDLGGDEGAATEAGAAGVDEAGVRGGRAGLGHGPKKKPIRGTAKNPLHSGSVGKPSFPSDPRIPSGTAPAAGRRDAMPV
jgi:hypothetical protein